MRSLVIGLLLVWGATFARGGGGGGGSPLAGWWVLYAEDTRGVDWHATVRIDRGDVGGGDGATGEFVWDTPSEFDPRYFGREFFEGTFDAGTRGVTLQGFELVEEQRVGTATYRARLAADGQQLVEGSWEGPSVRASDFFVAVRSGVVAEGDFDSGADGWGGAARWDAVEGVLVSGGDGGSALVAPAAFHGDWSWRGRVPALLGFEVRWTGEGNPTSGPVVTITGGGGTARFAVTARRAFEDVGARSYVLPLRGDLWEREGEVGWQGMLAAVDGLTIVPGTGNGGEFFVDEVRVIRPVVKPEPKLVEWGFGGGALVSDPGGGGLEALAVNLVSGESVGWGEALASREEEVAGSVRSVLEVPERPSGANPLLDESPVLALDGLPVEGNGGGRRVNAYSVVWDLKLVGEALTDAEGRDQGGWTVEDFRKSSGVILWQSGSIDGGAIVVEYGRVKGLNAAVEADGSVGEGGREIVVGQWHRVVLTVDASAGEIAVYVDGVLVFDEGSLAESGRPVYDGRYSLGGAGAGASLPSMFGSHWTLGNAVVVAGVAFLDVAMGAEAVVALGGVRGDGVLAPVFGRGLEIDAVALPGSMTLGFQPVGGYPYVLERSEDLCRWDVEREFVGVGGGRYELEVDAAGGGQGFFRVRPVVD